MAEQRDIITLVEAVYRVEEDEQAWLRGIATHTTVLARGNIGAYALTYDASDVEACTFGVPAMVGIDSPILADQLTHDFPAFYATVPDVVEAVFRHVPYGLSSRLPLAEKLAPLLEMLGRAGVQDVLGVNGVNVDGRGAHAGLLIPRSRPTDTDVLARISSHLASAYRLRSRLAGSPLIDHADAVIDPSGKIVHAEGEAKVRGARDSLADAAKTLDRLRSPAARRDPERAVRQWKALVDARWSLVDHFERGGRRYIVATRNDPALAPLALLSQRERQVVALLAIGHSNKMIGYELGISVSTVGVLLTRASRKLGARSRRALIAAYEARSS